jgi:hypothetical protein
MLEERKINGKFENHFEDLLKLKPKQTYVSIRTPTVTQLARTSQVLAKTTKH